MLSNEHISDLSQFLTQSGEAANFTEQLISIIRQQRHLASRVIISTQEPTLSPQLLELCNVAFVHRFRSPRWLVSTTSIARIRRDTNLTVLPNCNPEFG